MTTTSVSIRLLTAGDAQAYHVLRLEGLREAPTAFGSAFEEEAGLSLAQVADRLTANYPDIATFGAFLNGQMIGIATLVGSRRVRTGHKAMVAGMYVTASARGQGVGRALLDAIVAHGRSLPQVEELYLTVTVGNEAARRLYLAAGFALCCVIPRAIKMGSQRHDMAWMELRL